MKKIFSRRRVKKWLRILEVFLIGYVAVSFIAPSEIPLYRVSEKQALLLIGLLAVLNGKNQAQKLLTNILGLSRSR